MSSIRELTRAFPEHLKKAIEIGSSFRLKNKRPAYTNVLVCGLGGSGIGGSILASVASEKCPVPVLVCKDYTLPTFVNENTLLIASSYSGSTEETLAAVEEAQKRKAHIVCLSSGGKLLQIAQTNALDYIEIPGGIPPRTAFGYSFPQLYYILVQAGLLPESILQEIASGITLIEAEKESIYQTAEQICLALFQKIPVIYAAALYEPILVRFRQQLNENAKMLVWHHVLPEMNHNELVGWKNENKQLAVCLLRNADDNLRTQKRMDICKPIISKLAGSFTEISSKGITFTERILYSVHLLDWVSVLLAEKRNIDAEEIAVINYLKDELSKF